MRPQLMGNLSDDEDKFEEDGTPILVKLEVKSDDSEEENTLENDEAPTQAAPMAQTRTETASQDAGSTDSSSEEDDEPPPDKIIEDKDSTVKDHCQQI